MLIDVSQKILDFDGKQAREVNTEVDEETGKIVPVRDEEGRIVYTLFTFKMLAMAILNHTYQGDNDVDWKKKLTRGLLMARLNEAIMPIELKAEECTLIKTLGGKCPLISPWHVRQIEAMIEKPKVRVLAPTAEAAAPEASAA